MMDENVSLYLGDCRVVMAQELAAESVDSIVCDPPYGLSFMGKGWDHGVPGALFWEEALRVAKPGAHLLAFGGSRTFHRLAVAIEDAGWEIRDTIMWVYGSGFPKSLDVSKAIDAKLGVADQREVTHYKKQGPKSMFDGGKPRPASLPASLPASQWAGWGTALKPAHEPIILARKPLRGTVAENVLAFGTGALNVDGCRVECGDKAKFPAGVVSSEAVFGGGLGRYADRARLDDGNPQGRWPANWIHDGSEEVVGLFPETGASKASLRGERAGKWTDFGGGDGLRGHHDDGGSAARFFYTAKASPGDREEGLDGLEAKAFKRTMNGGEDTRGRPIPVNRNHHPTVKPTDLMRYLCRLVTPPGGVVLDPFMGSGSTGKGAREEGFRFVGIEMEPEYWEIARARIAKASPRPLPERRVRPKEGDDLQLEFEFI